MELTLIFHLGNIDSISNSATGQPFIQVFLNATSSKAGTSTMTAVVILLLSSCVISEVATASRQIWSFARDEGFPGSNWLAKVI